MLIKSKFASVCSKCDGPVNVGDSVNWEPGVRGVSHVDPVVCNFYKQRNMMVEHNTPAVPAPNTKMLPLAELMKSIDLKKPTLRLKFNDNLIALSLTKGGKEPGSIAVVMNGEFQGCIRKSGESTSKVRTNVDLQDYLLSVAVDKETLIKEAVIYGKFTNNCSFCGLELTHDYSVMVGYGPICADRWGLPHAYNGTADNMPNLPAAQKKKFMALMMEEEEGEE